MVLRWERVFFTLIRCIYAATKEVSAGKGVLYLFGNYAGDSMSFDMARELAGLDDTAQIAKVCDDVASAPSEEADRRRIADSSCL